MANVRIVIAIDGPAASGKGTLARRLAAHYGLHHLDTGLSYRAVAKVLLDGGKSLDDQALAEKAARELDLGSMDRDTLSSHAIGEAASKVAVMPSVRRALVEKQREFALRPAGAILDGRDIGTVVLPNAPVKLYVTASPEVRARRRADEIRSKGGPADDDAILADIRKRDDRDSNRADSPLKPAENAHLIDTSNMDIETAFLVAVQLIDKTMAEMER